MTTPHLERHPLRLDSTQSDTSICQAEFNDKTQAGTEKASYLYQSAFYSYRVDPYNSQRLLILVRKPKKNEPGASCEGPSRINETLFWMPFQQCT
eukprot:scaffold503354_cov32-Prasinocladus_malaysianus.AAC.1